MHLKSLVIASSGGALELYNFITFGLFATIFLPQLLPEYTNIVQINIFAFEIIIIGYMARIGGTFLFAPIGDKYGRRRAILLSMLLGGVATIMMAIMPTYAQIGILSPIIFVFARILQGITLGVSIGGAIVYTAELSHKKNRSFWMSITFLLLQRGVLMALGINIFLLNFLSSSQLHEWGWRLAFSMGFIILFITYYYRNLILETHDNLITTQNPVHLYNLYKINLYPVKTLFHTYKIILLQGIALGIIFATCVSVLIYGMPNVLLSSHFSVLHTTQIEVYNLCIISFSLPLIGWILDRIQHLKQVFIITMVILIIIIQPLLQCIVCDNIWIQYLGMTVFDILVDMIHLLFPVLVAGLFPANIRFTGVNMTFNICISIITIIFLWYFQFIYPHTLIAIHNHMIFISVIIICSACISLLGACTLHPRNDWLLRREEDNAIE